MTAPSDHRAPDPGGDEADGAPRRRLTSDERNEIARAGIRPLAPGERPWPLLVAVALSLLLAAGNVVAMVARVDVAGREYPVGPTIAIAGILVALAFAMWMREAVAVLIFMGLLVVTILLSFARLLAAANLTAVGVTLVTIVLSGWLFWKLVRVLSRIQAPPAAEPRP